MGVRWYSACCCHCRLISLAIVLENCAGLSALGPLDTTVSALFEGAGAVTHAPCFGVPVKYAPFPEQAWRAPSACALELASHFGAAALPQEPDLFVYCAAKGDLRALDIADGPPPSMSSPLLNVQADLFRDALGIHPSRTLVVSNACASGAIGLEFATELLSTGLYTTALVAGFDPLSRFVATGFAALGALSHDVARPFDRTRDGLSLGEGAALAVLTRRTPHTGDICIAGAASSNDANHRTGPSRTGEGLLRAARAALRSANTPPEQVGAVKCHGTATVYNDAMEAKALAALFDGAPPPCVSVKGALGHTSGGGSLLEALIAADMLRRRSVPPTAGFRTLGVEEPVPVSNSPCSFTNPSILCLSAGFGGVNAVLLLSECLS